MRFGFLLKRGKLEARQLAGELSQLLRSRHERIFVADAADLPSLPGAVAVREKQLGESVDVLVVLGGDGTFLYGAGLVSDFGVPIFGVNLGSMGFMTRYQTSEAAAALIAISEGRLPVDERMRLSVTVRSAEGELLEARNAVNDAVISQPAMARLLDLDARLDGEAITSYKSDGLILATPIGSTAYNLAAGGPILSPDLEAIVLSPICPHTLTNRPLVVRADSHLTVTNVSEGAAQLTIDGQWGRPLLPGQSIRVGKAERPLRVFGRSGSFFEVLHEKLFWGERQG
jgi:NAD+ kinase